MPDEDGAELSSWHYEVDLKDSDEQEDIEKLLDGLGLCAAPTSRHKRKDLTIVSVREFGGSDSEYYPDTRDMQYGLLIHDPVTAPLVGEAIQGKDSLVPCSRPVGPMRLRKCIQSLAMVRSAQRENSAKAKRLADQNLSVLIVDDSSTNLMLLSMFCRRRGMRYVQAVNGMEAFETYVRKYNEGDPCRAVLCDIQMPVLDGPGCICMIRAFEMEQGIAPAFVAMLTGLTDEVVRQECFKLGADGYFVKLISLAAINAIMQGTFAKTDDST
ncbi:hypothetical protein HDV00_009353 [Rhizophlyctis rosea]|nr:hypothetical protein HDV00_009353 [Rhizophlyctis rosea]